MLDNIRDQLADIGKVEQEPKLEGRAMHMILTPLTHKRP
jgi:translation initiation factor IF-3